MEERRVEGPLLTNFAADRAPLLPLYDWGNGCGFGGGLAKAADAPISAALGTLCGVEVRDVFELLSDLEEVVVMEGQWYAST
jgi:hypothetical protein